MKEFLCAAYRLDEVFDFPEILHDRGVGEFLLNTNLPFDQFAMGIGCLLRRGNGPGHCIFRLTFAGVFNIFSMASQTLNHCRQKNFLLIPSLLDLGIEMRTPRMG